MINDSLITFPNKTKDEPKVPPCDHHVQSEFCTTRAAYRQGKELKAVKVYTVNDESKHLLIQNVPSIGLLDEIKRLTARFGKIQTVEFLANYPTTAEFTHVYYVKYALLRDARLAKKKLDNRSFFGSILHVCYASELESLDDCKEKILDRITSVQKRWKHPNPTNCRNKKTKIEDKPVQSSSLSDPEVVIGTWSNLLPSTSSRIIPNSSSSSR